MGTSGTEAMRGANEPKTEFSGAQYSHAYPPGAENMYWHLARNRIIEAQVRASGARRVLDIGCGRGILVEHLARRGIDCYGVELAPVSVPPQLQDRLFTGIPAEHLAPDLRLSIDTLFLGDVLEHLPHPVMTLQSILAAYPRASRLIVAVPARQELWSNYDEYYGHYRRYDLASLHETVEAVGFSVSEIRYMFRLLYLPMRALAMLGRARETVIRPPTNQIVHRTGAALIYADFLFLPRAFYGTSVICRAVRRLPGA